MQTRTHLSLSCLCALVCCLAGLSSAVAGENPTKSRLRPEKLPKTINVRLELALEQWDQTDWKLALTLRNVGDVPIVIDRDLVLGFTVEVADRDGTRIEAKTIPSPESTSTYEERRKRVISLPSGQAISRPISLKKGWRVLRGGQGVDSEQRTIAVTGYEELVRLPQDAKPRSITARYGASPGQFWDAFLGFMGHMSLKEAKVYLGEMTQTIELVE